MPSPSENLTRRSLLNSAGSLLVYVVYLAAGFLGKKYLVLYLGTVAFGAWEVCFRLLNYVSPGEGPVSQALKWTLANKRDAVDDAGLRRYVGAAFMFWRVLVLPVLIVGGGIAWFSPRFIADLPGALTITVRWTSLIVVIGLLADTWSRLYLGVLQGMHQLYKATWVTSAFHVVTMALMVTAGALGFGLPGVAAALIVSGVAAGLTYRGLVGRWVPWFGMERPEPTQTRELRGMGGWMYAWTVVSRLLFLSDLVVVGMVSGAVAVTSLTFTQYAPHMGIYLAALITTSVTPGLGPMIGAGDVGRVRAVREELIVLIWLLIVGVGSVTLLWNEALISLWVGADRYSGAVANVLLVLIFAQMAWIRMDAFIIDVTLKVRGKVAWGLAAASLTIALSFLLGRSHGVVGVLTGVLIGRSLLNVAYPLLLNRMVSGVARFRWVAALRMTLATLAIFGVAMMLAPRRSDVGWFSMICGGLGTGLASVGLAWVFGLDGRLRSRMWSRLTRLGLPGFGARGSRGSG